MLLRRWIFTHESSASWPALISPRPTRATDLGVNAMVAGRQVGKALDRISMLIEPNGVDRETHVPHGDGWILAFWRWPQGKISGGKG
jgi:hypothetical protein